jgi:hypothetical protein
MSKGWESIFNGVDALAEREEDAMLDGLNAGAVNMQATLQTTDAYENQSGATRISTVAFVAHGDDDGAEIVGEAIAQAEELNPGKVVAYEIEGASHPRVIATAFTSYTEYLETTRAAQNAFLAPAMDEQAPHLHEQAIEAMREVYR